ncbi:hypothetical protein [Actinacidiphila sp. ITFR-21]|uniref:hypothetical protein n=1 Tax=Actinacidiphila sp. ITFR-21 TaxID=3075199 RepID=UPI00288C50D8|nr:hypothetical protein [Streptomyces sp. ITFR-21]WNI20368.1 hypothetical protein RLT57_32715 [Streptomyces sp. ITFR-21]
MSHQHPAGRQHHAAAPHSCHGCCHCAAQDEQPPEPFRFSDVPPIQWIVGGALFLFFAVAILIRST